MRRTLTALAIFASGLAWSNPSGHHVVHGEAQVTHSHQTCHIHANDHTVIHWQDFSIGVGEITRFTQPSNQSVVLNQVVGNRLSEIYGTLEANGKLFLLNQNGILFGENALVNVGELIASTLNLSLEDFLKDDTLHFHGSSKAAIINHGTLKSTSGNVSLFSRHILNTGSIETFEGKTELVAAADVLLKPHSAKRILIQPSCDEKTDSGIDQQGIIAALETYLEADGYLYDLAIKHGGEIDALTFQHENGRVLLRADQGTTAISGTIRAPHGEITALGKQVLILDKALLSVSDRHHAGNIQLGGSSDLTFVAAGARLEASAFEAGPGGNIFVLSEGTSLFLGKAEVRAGLYGGNAGFIEVSGNKSTLFHGTTDRFAPFGTNGTLLIDPEANFVISTLFEHNYTSMPPNFIPKSDVVNLSIDTLLAELTQGPVTIQTYFEGLGGLPGHIRFSSDVISTYDSPHTLTLNSTGKEGIIWNGKLVNTGTGNIELLAKNGPILVTPELSTTPAFIQTAGHIKLDATGAIDILGQHTQCAGIKTTQAGSITLQSQEGIALSSTLKAPALIHVENGPLKIDSIGHLNLNGRDNAAAELRSNGMGDIIIQRAGSIDLFGESGPALISFSHQFGNLVVDNVKQGIELWAFQDTAAIEGGLGSITLKRIEGDINLMAEHADASISAVGPLTIQTNGSIQLDAIQSDATIGSNHLVQLSSGGTFLLTAEEGNSPLPSRNDVARTRRRLTQWNTNRSSLHPQSQYQPLCRA
ncbi:filamentous hemagglutinin N-terminal domain-containing protein [Simkania sp.]|uniref:two-partner secretion domain-containing protein n=1 Tax=Simkania sp. TaxID=34094 RepID=UPI003B51B64B